ncbi:ATP-binding protein [Desertibaculum subflavum]|uniref:ATP-binding protein n=1 Tax=Desertibaculum subflavum TaxID=2268458 RepID=UPI000E66D5D3
MSGADTRAGSSAEARPVTVSRLGAARLDQAVLEALERLPDPLWIWDCDAATVIWTNAAASGLWQGARRDIDEVAGSEVSPVTRRRLAAFRRRAEQGEDVVEIWSEPVLAGGAKPRCRYRALRSALGHRALLVAPVPDGTTLAPPLVPAAGLLAAQNAVLTLIARGAGIARTLDRVVELLEEQIVGAVPMAALLDPVSGRLVPVAARGIGDRLAACLDSEALACPTTPLSAAALRGAPILIADLATEEWSSALGHAVAAEGLRACWAQPVLDQAGDAVGVIAVFSAEARMPGEAELALLDGFGAIAAIAIERHRKDEALNAANERLASLAENLPGVIYQRVVRPDGDIRYTYISEGTRDMFGVSPEEVLADPRVLFACHGPDYSRDFRDNLIQASRELRMWDVEAQIITRDGKQRWTHAIAKPSLQPDGSVVWDGIILDATRLKQANLELAAVNRAKTDFLANVSHELRTPLNAIIGFSEMMREEAFGPLGDGKYREYINDIHDSGSHLLRLINDILDLSKIESGKADLADEVIDLARVMRACVRIVAERAEEGGIALNSDIAPGLKAIRGDERKMKQILINLLSNAIKFTTAGGRVEATVGLLASGEIEFAVADTGIGIAAEDIPRVTEPFVQVDSGLDRRYEGTGLGLTLTKAMTEQHGGRLEIESAVGAGTTVRVVLPADRVVG